MRLATLRPRNPVGYGFAMRIARDLDTLRQELTALRHGAGSVRRIALVPTMGALHAGHLALVEAARRHADHVVASIFVNPLQFNASDDLARYPRDEEGDLAKLASVGCDLVWMPGVEAMYPPGNATVIEVGGPAERWEGAHRPGHFRGVATVCTKLFMQTGAELAAFGEKDWQQVQVVRRVVRDLDLPIRILPVPTVREADGLALSSRNRFLTAEDRALAPRLPAALRDAAAAIETGAAPPAEAVAAATAALTALGFSVDYLALVEPETLVPLEELPREPRGGSGACRGRLIAAARLGSVRLLDNWPVGEGA